VLALEQAQAHPMIGSQLSNYWRNIWNTLIYYLHQNTTASRRWKCKGAPPLPQLRLTERAYAAVAACGGRGTGRVILRSDSAESGRNRDEGALDDLAARDVGVLLDKALPPPSTRGRERASLRTSTPRSLLASSIQKSILAGVRRLSFAARIATFASSVNLLSLRL
jgi:hypothetical protein